ncbi:response regulator [Desulfobacula sp.]|uniref:hybrid sensor histidine kinase/response regulator n=1 Tax=Desulfobacula sp. TaxID=2593537 RepID=UPI002615117F|nr:response regulator [Desulfobacula sp.]
MKHFFFHSIKGKLLIALTFLFGAALLIQLVYIAPKFQKRKMEEIKLSQNKVATYLADQITLSLDTAAKELREMSSLPAFVSMDKASLDDTVNTLNRSNHFFNYYFVMDNDGKWLSYPTHPKLVGEKIPMENIHWVNETFETGKTVFLDVVKSKIGTLVGGFSTPINDTDGGRSALLRGVLILSGNNALVKVISTPGLLKNSHVYLVSSKGWLIAHSHQKLNYNAFNEYRILKNEPVEKVLKGQTGTVTYAYDHKKWIASFHPIGITNWGLIVQQPLETVVSAAKSETRGIIFLILGCFFMGLLIAAFWVQKSLTPLIKLVKDIQSGSVDVKTDYPKDEIGQLAFKYRSLFNELHRSNLLIQRSEIKFRTLFNSANDAIYIIDLNGKFLEVNQKAIDLMQYSREELLKMNISDIYAHDSDPVLQSPVDEQQPRRKLIFETTCTTKTRKLIPVEISSSHIEYDNRNAILRVARDLTERRRFEEKIRHSHKMEAIGTLAGGIAHDFNNILSGIFGFSQLARNNLSHPEKAKKNIDQIIKVSHKASALVQQILAVSRKSPHKKHPLSLCVVVKESLKLLRAIIPTTIQIKQTDFSEALVMADPGQIHQVIMNLFTNAYHAMQKNGGILSVGLNKITVSQQACILGSKFKPGQYLKLDVSDTGHGIEPAIMEKIFDPYFTTKESGKGTGLGLAIVLGIVQEHNGHIDVFSEPEKGTTFHVYLPIVEQSADPHPSPEKESPVSGTEKILLVDDEECLLRTVQELLKELGYAVSPFQNGHQAFDVYAQQPGFFDVVITDMTMPEMTGLELAKKILRLRPDQPIILCTGHNELINRQKALDMGISEYYEKPVVISELVKIIRNVLEGQKTVP